MIDNVTYDPSHENLDERGLNSFKNAKQYNQIKESSQTRNPNYDLKSRISPKMNTLITAKTP